MGDGGGEAGERAESEDSGDDGDDDEDEGVVEHGGGWVFWLEMGDFPLFRIERVCWGVATGNRAGGEIGLREIFLHVVAGTGIGVAA